MCGNNSNLNQLANRIRSLKLQQKMTSLSYSAPPFVPQRSLDKDEMEHITQKRLQRFLISCAKQGIPIRLNAANQSNASFDTMLEVSAECDAIGIPKNEQPIAVNFDFPLPPTPKTNDPRCMWQIDWNDDNLTPEISEGAKYSPDFNRAFQYEQDEQDEQRPTPIWDNVFNFCTKTFCEAMEKNYINPEKDEDMLTITEIMRLFGPGIPEGYDFDPEEFGHAYVKYWLYPENYWDEITFVELMDQYGPRPPRTPRPPYPPYEVFDEPSDNEMLDYFSGDPNFKDGNY